ncbi:MAG: polysaccharide biosynthesis/export family protein [Bacteroidota bacterium]
MKKYFPFLIIALFLSSCKIFSPSQMLRTGRDFKYAEFPATQDTQQYKIAPDDKISFTIATNNGENLINPVSGAAITMANAGGEYTVEYDGMVKLPILGRVKMSGMTLREAEKFLENSYSKFYNEPFVQLKVTNSKVILFMGGEGGTSSVLTLEKENTTLFEAIAQAGGISDGKAFKIKLIRGNLKDPQIYLIDLSTLDGMKKADLVLQANDIIYVQPRNRYPEKFLAAVTPYLSLASFILLIAQTVK